MNKLIIIGFIFLGQLAICQTKNTDGKKTVWKNEKDYLKYVPEREYKGPDDWYAGSPASLKKDLEDYSNNSSNSGSHGIQYNPQQIQQDREKQYGNGGGNGTLKNDPTVKPPDPITLPDIDPPDVDMPDLPNIDAPTIPLGFWQILLFIILFAGIIAIVYFYLKNRQPSNNKAIVYDVENDWNPEIITKSELELRLEEALSREDYREGVRIYFTFILKELIRKNCIHWKKDKTNYHYLIEMTGKNGAGAFYESVRIYDLVWYGEYEIDRNSFEMVQPTLLNFYKSLEA